MECNIVIDWEDPPLSALADVCHYEVSYCLENGDLAWALEKARNLSLASFLGEEVFLLPSSKVDF